MMPKAAERFSIPSIAPALRSRWIGNANIDVTASRASGEAVPRFRRRLLRAGSRYGLCPTRPAALVMTGGYDHARLQNLPPENHRPHAPAHWQRAGDAARL